VPPDGFGRGRGGHRHHGDATATPTRPGVAAVAATGDALIHQGRALVAGAAAAGAAGGTDYDFSGVFADVAPVISAADLAICHLETPVAPPWVSS
jgi:hypothetical protein